MDSLDKLLLQTLSFFKPLSMEQILLDMDGMELETLRELTVDDLLLRLEELTKKKILKRSLQKGEKVWQKNYMGQLKRKGPFVKLLNYLSGHFK